MWPGRWGSTEFGAFSLAFATYLIVLAASRGLATDALAVRYSGVELGRWRRAVASATGTATVVGLIAGAGCVAVGHAVPTSSTGAALVGLGLTLPGLLLQDSWRFAFFSAGKGGWPSSTTSCGRWCWCRRCWSWW